ncbi:hypothetical protein TrRE_jg9753, partial [Triparma retinervis]
MSKLDSSSSSSCDSYDSFVVIDASDLAHPPSQIPGSEAASLTPARAPAPGFARTKSWSDIVSLTKPTVVSDPNSRSSSPEPAMSAWKAALTGAEKLTSALATFSCTHSHTYGLVARHHMVGTQLLVFAQGTALPMIRGVQCGQVPCGNMGLGNKGGVMIRMDVMDTSVCFVSSHFAAHRGKVKARNRDYKTIANRHCFVDLVMEKFRKTMAASHRARNKVRKRDRIKGIVRKEQRDVVDKHSDNMKEVHGQMMRLAVRTMKGGPGGGNTS